MATIVQKIKSLFVDDQVVLLGEQSRDRSSVSDMWGGYVENPNLLVQKKGIEIFDKMLGDPQIKSAFFLKRICRLAPGWEIEPTDNSDSGEEQAQFIRDVFSEMDGSLDSSLVKLWDGQRCGYKIAEKNYRYYEEGPLKGKVGLANIKVRNSKYYAFDTDIHGNLLPDGLIEDPNGDADRLPVNKFIIFSWGAEDDDGQSLYGHGDFICIYPNWFANKLWLKLWSLTLERYAMPTAVGKVSSSASIEIKNFYLDILESLHTKSAALVPTELEYELLDTAGKTKENQFQTAMEFNNKQMMKGLLIGEMLQEGPKVGGLGIGGLSETQFNMFVIVLEHLGKVTEDEIVGEQLIRDIIDKNYPPEKRLYPKFKMGSVRRKDNAATATVIKLLIDAGVIDPEESWIRSYTGVPQLTEEERIELDERKKERQQLFIDAQLAELKAGLDEKQKTPKEKEEFNEWWSLFAEDIKKKFIAN